MKPLLLILGFCLLLGGNASSAERPPNIVLLFADDLGWSALGCYGSKFYETPNLDRLAEQGARFTGAYAACQVCSPTRASLMTGQWPQRSGITDYIGAPAPDRWSRNTTLLPAPNADRLDHAVPTLASTLRDGGYTTFFAGKWHLGPEGWWPENHGFDVNKGGHDRGGPCGGDKYFSHYGNQGGAPSAAVRRDQWKLIEWMEDRRLELYDLSADLGETNNLYRDRPELADELYAELRAWQKSVGAQFPTPTTRTTIRPETTAATRPDRRRSEK